MSELQLAARTEKNIDIYIFISVAEHGDIIVIMTQRKLQTTRL